MTTKETLSVERGPAAAPATPTTLPAPSVGRTTRAAAARRRRVLGVVLALLAVTVVLGATGVLGWAWTAVPATLLVAWLVACRLMVRGAAGRARAVVAPGAAATSAVEAADDEDPAGETTQEVAVVVAQSAAEESAARAPLEPGMWDPVPVTLPTYVDKAPAARRTVRTIDLDSTGVWTSGRSEVDSALAREAEEAERAARAEEQARSSEQRRASGS